MSNKIKYDFTGANKKFAKKLKNLGGDIDTILRYMDQSAVTGITYQDANNIIFEAPITGFGSSSVNLFGENLELTDNGLSGTLYSIELDSANYGYIEISEAELDLPNYDLTDLRYLHPNEDFFGTEFNDFSLSVD